MSFVRRAAAPALLCLVSAGTSLLVAEAVVRKWYPVSVSAAGLDDIDGVTVMRPNVRGRHAVPKAYDIRFSTSAQRFRGGTEYALQPPLGTTRIIMLGDSFTFGAGVEDDETYPVELGRILNSQEGEHGSRVEIINAGVPGTGTGEQALYYDVWVKQFRSHLVILSVYVNDVDDDQERRLFTSSPKGVTPRPKTELAAANSTVRKLRRTLDAVPGYKYLAQHSQLLNFVRLRISELIHRYRVSAGTGLRALSPPRSVPREESRAVTAGEIEWLDERIQQEGSKLLVVFIPARDNVDPSSAVDDGRTMTEPMIRNLKEICDARGLPFADLTPAMVAAARSSAKPLYYAHDPHATPEGYRAIAAAVAHVVDENGLL